MNMRKDALACAAAWIAEVEREALTTSGLVATVGKNRGGARRRQRRARRARPCRSTSVIRPIAMRKAAVERLTQAAEEIATRPRLDR